MSIKKLLILSAAGFAAVTSAAAFAGGPDEMSPQSLFTPAVYADVHGGYSWYNWKGMTSNMTTIWFNNQGITKNEDGGWIGGADVGLQVFKNIGFEVGGFYLPKVVGYVNTSTNSQQTSCGNDGSACYNGDQYNWAAYAAGKFSVDMPYVEGLDMFAKIGGAWRAMSNENQAAVAGRGGMKSYWTVIYGAGFEYDLMQTGFRVGVQWMRIPGSHKGQENPSSTANTPSGFGPSKEIATRQPTQDLVTGSVGYKFDF